MHVMYIQLWTAIHALVVYWASSGVFTTGVQRAEEMHALQCMGDYVVHDLGPCVFNMHEKENETLKRVGFKIRQLLLNSVDVSIMHLCAKILQFACGNGAKSTFFKFSFCVYPQSSVNCILNL